jgi:hypothetical protein
MAAASAPAVPRKEIIYTKNEVLTKINTIRYIDNISTTLNISEQELNNYKILFTQKTLKYISNYARSDANYISDYGKKYLELKKKKDDLEKMIKSLNEEKIKLKYKDIMDTKLPEQYLYVYVKSTNLKSFGERFLLMPSYIGWKSDRPTLRHFVLPNETALTRDEFMNNNKEIANEELIDLYKMKVFLEQYIYVCIEFEKHRTKCDHLKNIINDDVKPKFMFKARDNYSDFLEQFKKKLLGELDKYWSNQRIADIGKTQLKQKAETILSDLLKSRRGDENAPEFAVDRKFTVEIEKETAIYNKLKGKIEATDPEKYIERLNKMKNNISTDDNIKKNLKSIEVMLGSYTENNKPLLNKIKEVLDAILNSSRIVQPNDEITANVRKIKQIISKYERTKQEQYEEIKRLFDKPLFTIDDIKIILEQFVNVLPAKQKEILMLLNKKILELRDKATTIEEKEEFTDFLKQSIDKEELLKFVPVATTIEEEGNIKEHITLDTDLKNKIEKDKNIDIIKEILKNINEYLVSQNINQMYNFKYDSSSILKIKTDGTLSFILETIIDINIQMRKINSIASKGQNIRIMLFKEVVELLLNKVVKGRKLMATRDFYFIIKDVKWSPKERKDLNNKEKLLLGSDKKAYEIEISLVLSIEGRSDTSLAFERKCNENEQAIGQIWNEFYGGLKNAINDKLDELDADNKKPPNCRELGSLNIQGINQCLTNKGKSRPLDVFFEFSIPRIYRNMPTYARMPERKSYFTGIEVEFPIRNTIILDDGEEEKAP